MKSEKFTLSVKGFSPFEKYFNIFLCLIYILGKHIKIKPLYNFTEFHNFLLNLVSADN